MIKPSVPAVAGSSSSQQSVAVIHIGFSLAEAVGFEVLPANRTDPQPAQLEDVFTGRQFVEGNLNW